VRIAEYAEYDATALAALIRAGEVDGTEIYEAALAALDAVNPRLNALADGPWEQPLPFAADGPFGGVPFVLKDLGAHPQGVPIRAGSRLSGSGISFPHESHLVERFRKAGLATAAVTTTPEFGLSTNTEPVVYGSTRNPWDVARSAGGSSGGSAALVAAGAVPIGHAGDAGGSIRVPASCCGLVGLKPSRGRVSDGPDRQEVLYGLAADFVLVRTVRDCAAALDAVAGAMPGDKFIVKEPARPWASEVNAEPGALRVALHTRSWSDVAVDAEVARAVEDVGRELERLGHHVEAAAPEFSWDEFIAATVTIWANACAEAVHGIAALTGNRPGVDTLERTTLALYEHGRGLTALELGTALQRVNTLARGVGAFFTRWDVLVTPTMAVQPTPLGYLNADDPSLTAEGWVRRVFGACPFTALFNCAGTPAISVPSGRSSTGLPIGVQLAAAMCDESVLIALASQLEVALPWRDLRPAVHAAVER
jgi:amidase